MLAWNTSRPTVVSSPPPRKIFAVVLLGHAGDAVGLEASTTPREFLQRFYANSRSVALATELEDCQNARFCRVSLVPAGETIATPAAAARHAFGLARLYLLPWELASCQALVFQRPANGLLAFVVKIGQGFGEASPAILRFRSEETPSMPISLPPPQPPDRSRWSSFLPFAAKSS